jgi:hypothetical protein
MSREEDLERGYIPNITKSRSNRKLLQYYRHIFNTPTRHEVSSDRPHAIYAVTQQENALTLTLSQHQGRIVRVYSANINRRILFEGPAVAPASFLHNTGC